MNLWDILLGEISHTGKDEYCMISRKAKIVKTESKWWLPEDGSGWVKKRDIV